MGKEKAHISLSKEAIEKVERVKKNEIRPSFSNVVELMIMSYPETEKGTVLKGKDLNLMLHRPDNGRSYRKG